MIKIYPKGHLIAVSAIASILGLVLLIAPSEEASATRKSVTIPVALAISPVELDENVSQKEQTELEVAAKTKKVAKINPAPKENWKTIKIKSGDNLTTLFKRAGLGAREVHEVAQATKKKKSASLKRLYPGETLSFLIDNGKLQKLRRVKNPLESVEFIRTDSGYDINPTTLKPDVEIRFVSATLDNSLFLAGQKAGLPQKVIMELAYVFGGVIDFIYDPRKGDSFNLLYEEKYLNGKLIGTGHIIAAEFNNRGESYKAFRYTDSKNDTGYYSLKGVSMQKAFLRAPVDFTRISSGFNLRRKHPIHKKIRAHRGTDYAAPRGTPVYAAGTGRVIASGYNRANGNYVFIQHGPKYTTKYLHLHKRKVKKGQRVKQRQVIGQVGTTGYSTGPHLHYEFLVNGVHRNPRTIVKKLPKAKSIAKAEKSRFLNSIQPTLARIETHQQLLAYNK